MFGFLRGSRCNRTYRQVYAGCCAVQHQKFGISSLAFLSYEAIFLYLIALDAKKCDPPSSGAATCCRLRSNQRTRSPVDPMIAEYASAMGLLLASVKIDDDIIDDRSWVARFARWWLRKPFKKCHAYFSSIDTEFQHQIKGYLNAHAEMEKAPAPATLEQYVKPTANAFGYVYRLMASKVLKVSPDLCDTFERIGKSVGASIIAFDCAVDWHQDQRRNRYNPLSTEKEISGSLQLCRRQLSQAIWLCDAEFGTESVCTRVLRDTFQRTTEIEIRRSRKKPSLGQFRKAGLSVLRRGDCDCCCPCEACGECHNCMECCSSCHTCGENCGGCPDPCVGCDCDSNKKKKTPQVHQANQPYPPNTGQPVGTAQGYTPMPTVRIGSVGTAVGPINPTGVVHIAFQEYPAKSEGLWIADGQSVEVIGMEVAGLVVRPYTNPKQ